MEVTALCVTLVMTVFLQLGAHAWRVEFLIVPSRLQLFEYEPVSFKCTGFDGSTEWSVLRKTETDNSTCGFQKWGVKDESSCTIRYPYEEDSGEYWCEVGGGQKSNSVNITVTAGSVILESPVLPVMEGNDVTMSCRNKTTSSNLKADFYKDGVLIRNSSTGEMTIHSVSKSDEGFYKCNISGAGESAENRLTVRTVRGATRVDAEFLIVPTKLQLYEYEPVSFKCTGFDGSTEWSVLRKTETDNSTCGFQKWGVKDESSCTLRYPYEEDSGEYWCEAGGGQKSNSVNVTVTVSEPVTIDPVMSYFWPVRHVVVGIPYILTTVLLRLIYRDKRRESQRVSEDRRHRVIMDVE